jgi:DNA helicase-2/ATP-dependent DNA helicase PcrA
MKWSSFQTDIFNFIEADTGIGAVNAVAGSGKTTTIVEAVQRSKRPALLGAFNKHIAVELERRLNATPGVTVSTLHALGLRMTADGCNTKPQVNQRKYNDIVTWALTNHPHLAQQAGFESPNEAWQTLSKLVDFARLTLRDPLDPHDAFSAAAACYELEAPDPLLPLVTLCLDEGAAEAKHHGIIDFTDMIWLPHRWDLQTDTYPHIFVDEAQDLNAAQLDLVHRACATDPRGLVVGDPFQSIFGFAYAGLDAYTTARDSLNATELPLSICYRCPTSHLDLAREIVPHILARDDAPVGTIEHCFDNDLPTLVRPTDLVICRYTAPLINMCLNLIRARVRSYVKGRDIGVGLVKLIEIIRKRNANLAALSHTLQEYTNHRHEQLANRNAPASIHNALDDRIVGVRIIYEMDQPTDWTAFTRTATDLCSDNGTGVCLSTIHRVKGLEADRVWILQPEELGTRRTGLRGIDQETNVRLVALTRSKDFLGFVHSADPDLTHNR